MLKSLLYERTFIGAVRASDINRMFLFGNNVAMVFLSCLFTPSLPRK